MIAVLLLFSSIARADQSTGVIRLAVDDPAAGTVGVEISSSLEPARRWSAHASTSEPATVTGLPPAVYRVTATPRSGAAVSLEISVAAGDVVSLSLTSGVAGSALWQLATADRSRAAQGTSFSRDLIDRLPSGAGAWGLLDAVAPFVITDRLDTGGVALGTMPRTGSRGASWTGRVLRLGDFPVVEGPGAADQMAMGPDLNAFESATVAAGAATPDVDTPGATVILVPKRTGPERRVAFDGSFTPPGLVATNDTAAPSISRLTSWASGGVQFGAPLTPRLGLFVAGASSRMKASERGRTTPVSTTASQASARIVDAIGERTQLRLFGIAQRIGQPYGPLRSSGADVTESDSLIHTQAAVEHLTETGARLEWAVGYQRATFMPSVNGLAPIRMDRVTDGPIPTTFAKHDARRADAQFVFAPPELRGHGVEVGLSIGHVASTSRAMSLPAILEHVDGLPARVWSVSPSPLDASRSTTHLAGFLNDRIRVRPNLTINAGVRLAESNGSARDAAQGIRWHAVLPRASVRWTPRALTVFASYGRYQRELPLNLLAFGDPAGQTTDATRWNDLNRDSAIGDGELGPVVMSGRPGGSRSSIDGALKGPHTDELTFGAERRLGPAFLRVTGVVRRERDLVRSVNVGVPLSSYDVRSILDQSVAYDSPGDDRLLPVYSRKPESFQKDQYLLTNVANDKASYEGLEIAASFERGRWWSFAGASAFQTGGAGGNRGFHSDENDQGVIGDVYETPNAASYPNGRQFFDRAYVLKWATGYQGPRDVTVAVVARYQDGQPFSRLVVVPDLAQGPDIVPAYPNGRTRFTFTTTIDARVEKRFRVGTRAAAIRVEIYNLGNLSLEVEENPVTGPDFRRTTAVQPPSTLRVGFHYEF